MRIRWLIGLLCLLLPLSVLAETTLETSHGTVARDGGYALRWLQPDGDVLTFRLPMKCQTLFAATGSDDYLWVDMEGVDGAERHIHQLLCLSAEGSIISIIPLGDSSAVEATHLAAIPEGNLLLALQRASQTEIMQFSSTGQLVWHYALNAAEPLLLRLHPLTEAEATDLANAHLHAMGLSTYDLLLQRMEKDPHTERPCYYFFASHDAGIVSGYIDAATGKIHHTGTEADANG